MTINILLTKELKDSMPNTIEVIHNFGNIYVVFEDNNDMIGDNVVVVAEQDEIFKWLKPFDGVAIGANGSPQTEQFRIVHIKDNI
jgi:hypothetical protein